MKHNEEFRKVVNEKFKVGVKKNYLPDLTYINRLIASLDKVEANSYSQSQTGFISEYNYFEGVGALQSIKIFVDGCLNQLLWINSILESGKYAGTIEDLEEEFDYKTPTMLGNPWTFDKVTNKGVLFHGDEPFEDSQVIINSENIIEIAIALSTVAEQYNEHIADKKYEHTKSIVAPSLNANESTIFLSKELELKCLNVLKEIKHPVLNDDGEFRKGHGMRGAIVIWYDKCEFLGFISKTTRNRDEVANVVIKLIPGLTIHGSTFHKSPVAKKYKEDIEQKLLNLSHK